jgi:hypothetical protein
VGGGEGMCRVEGMVTSTACSAGRVRREGMESVRAWTHTCKGGAALCQAITASAESGGPSCPEMQKMSEKSINQAARG